MIGNELVLILWGHCFEWVECSFQVFILKCFTSFDNTSHDLESLFFGSTWTEWVFCQVSSNSDSSGINHGRFCLTEVSVGQLICVHIGNVLCFGIVSVIIENDFIEKFVELGISLMRTSIKTDSRIKV